WGTGMLGRLNGQFAFAIYDRRTETVLLARDRFGVRPLFYAIADGDLFFASEAKALFASGGVEAAPDFVGLDQVFTFWAARPPWTVFSGVHSIEPRCFAVWRDVAGVCHDVVWHAESPLVRTAPAPMYLLAQLAREHDIKVVLTGEGSDELFLGYDLFKETALRLFCLRQPQSRSRPRLFDRLYPYLDSRGRHGDFWRRSFLDAGAPDDLLFSHLPRFLLTSRIKDFYSADLRATLAQTDPLEDLRASLPASFSTWSPLNRAAYLEMVTLLSPYLLSAQGDRMSLAHGVEGRYPFLDHRLFEFAARLPTGSKLRGLR